MHVAGQAQTIVQATNQVQSAPRQCGRLAYSQPNAPSRIADFIAECFHQISKANPNGSKKGLILMTSVIEIN